MAIVSLAALSLGALAACSPPFQFPTGYVYHDREFKSPVPPSSSEVTRLQRRSMGPVQEAQWRDAAYDILNRLTSRAGLPPRPVHVQQADPLTPFYAAFDNNLREAMRHTGYQIAPYPKDSYVFVYSAAKLDLPQALQDRPAKDKTPNIRITLRIHDGPERGNRMLTEQIADYYIEGGETFHFTDQAVRDATPKPSTEPDPGTNP